MRHQTIDSCLTAVLVGTALIATAGCSPTGTIQQGKLGDGGDPGDAVSAGDREPLVDPCGLFVGFILSADSYRVGEAAGTAQVVVLRCGDSSTAASVGCSTSYLDDDPTIANPAHDRAFGVGDDYVGSFALLDFQPGTTSQVFPVTLIDDATPQPDLTFAVYLYDPTLPLGQPNRAQVVIIDDDSPGGDDGPPGGDPGAGPGEDGAPGDPTTIGDPVVGGPGVSLPAGRWTPAKMPLQILHPQPALAARSRYRKAHTDFAYQVPVTVQGGAAPFLFAINGAPAGMTIEARAPSWNPLAATWGVIRWPSPTAGSHTVTIQVTDQGGAVRTVDLTIDTDNAAFLFVDPNAAAGGNGSIGAPFNEIEDWYTNADTNADHSDKIVVYRGGNYVVPSPDPDLSNELRFASNVKPAAHIAFPGETPVWNMSATWIYYTGTQTDTYWDGIHFESSDNTKLNSRVFWFTGGNRRVTMWRLHFANTRVGTTSASNESCMWFSRSSSEHHFVSLADITYDNLPPGPNGFSLFDFYVVKNGSVDGLSAVNLRSTYSAWVKSGCDNVSVRHVDIWDASNNATQLLKVQQGSATPQSKVELLLSRARRSGDTKGVLALGDSNSDWGTIWVYRVTGVGWVGLDGPSAVSYGTAHLDASVLFNDETPVIGAGIDATGNVVGARSAQAGIIDAEGRIVGAERGKVGFEVYAD
jgi:hypothetical protein